MLRRGLNDLVLRIESLQDNLPAALTATCTLGSVCRRLKDPLPRERIGPVTLDRALPPGAWRALTEAEVRGLADCRS